MCVHDSALSKFTFLKNCGHKYFITWISSQLKQRITSPGQRLYSIGDEIDDFFFMTRGVSAFVRNYQTQTIIGVMDP